MQTIKNIYFSELLYKDYPQLFTCLEKILKDYHYSVTKLKMTKDIWIRDFMPLTLANNYIEYHYTPDYLQEDNLSYQTDPSLPIKELNLKSTKINLILDGGNVVKYKNIIIMTDKVLSENKITEKSLKSYFPLQRIIIIPRDPHKDEIYGHADGMVRFISSTHLLVNSLYPKDLKKKLHNELKKEGFKLTELKLKEETTYAWGYINFLYLENLIIQPSIDRVNDNYVKKQLELLYPSHTIELCDAKKLVKQGGLFNCISWEN